MKRAPAVVRAWDGPNSRIAFEMDLDQMPWGPFEALGKKVTVLIPEEPTESDGGVGERDEATRSHLDRALRHVEHAAAKCAEFAQMENGSDDLWRRSLETWEWLRSHLQTLTAGAELEAEPRASSQEGAPPLPGMPGAAATLEVAAAALRQTPLASWRDAVGTFNPDAPTREEAIQTLLGIARLLAHAPPARPNPAEAPAPESSEPTADPVSEAPSSEPAPDGGEGGELSFDFAAGYDEGYQMGRKVGRALAARSRKNQGS